MGSGNLITFNLYWKTLQTSTTSLSYVINTIFQRFRQGLPMLLQLGLRSCFCLCTVAATAFVFWPAVHTLGKRSASLLKHRLDAYRSCSGLHAPGVNSEFESFIWK